ncbi:hypothetical protein [Actinomadura sp. B10D3]
MGDSKRSVELNSQSWNISDEAENAEYDAAENAEDAEFSHLYARP